MTDEPEKKKREPGLLFLRGLSSPVKNLFKAKCVRRSLSMTEVVEALMLFYVEGDNAALLEPFLRKNRRKT